MVYVVPKPSASDTCTCPPSTLPDPGSKSMTVVEMLPDLFFVQRGYLNANHLIKSSRFM